MSTTEDARRLAELTEQITEYKRAVKQLEAEKDALLSQLHPAFNDDPYSELDFGDGKLVRTSRLGVVTYRKGSSEQVEQLSAFRGCAEAAHLISESLHWGSLQSWLHGMVGDDVAAECFHYSDQELGQMVEAGIPAESGRRGRADTAGVGEGGACRGADAEHEAAALQRTARALRGVQA